MGVNELLYVRYPTHIMNRLSNETISIDDVNLINGGFHEFITFDYLSI